MMIIYFLGIILKFILNFWGTIVNHPPPPQLTLVLTVLPTANHVPNDPIYGYILPVVKLVASQSPCYQIQNRPCFVCIVYKSSPSSFPSTIIEFCLFYHFSDVHFSQTLSYSFLSTKWSKNSSTEVWKSQLPQINPLMQKSSSLLSPKDLTKMSRWRSRWCLDALFRCSKNLLFLLLALPF